ncbi:XRE family transcriptional regulator [Rouxiella sp. Mn2063]|uniref:XRE family transcriptional regulator n=1 Tax=Rouxiella sp. Mn2063 TaxID=3395262 RepID=UPI003BC4B7EA
MKNTFAERLRDSRKSKGLSQKELGERVGISQAAIQKLERGLAASSTYTAQIAEELGVPALWLINGNDMQDGTRESSIPDESEWSTVDAWSSSSPVPSDEVEVPFLRDIELAAGDGGLSDDDYNGFKLRFSRATLRRVGASTDGKGVICFPAKGNSMEPVIPDGATVAVDTHNKKIIDGEIYAIDQGGLRRVKQLYRKPGGKVLIRSFNRDENDDEVEDESEIDIIGFVFWYSVIRTRR